MNIEIITLCERAQEADRRLSISRTFDEIFAEQVPAAIPQFTFVLRIRFTKIEGGIHRIKINLVDEDGRLMMPSYERDVEARFGDDMQSTNSHVILVIEGLQLDKFGEHAIDVAIDGRQEASLPFFSNRDQDTK